jgi:hypothetical protein
MRLTGSSAKDSLQLPVVTTGSRDSNEASDRVGNSEVISDRPSAVRTYVMGTSNLVDIYQPDILAPLVARLQMSEAPALSDKRCRDLRIRSLVHLDGGL